MKKMKKRKGSELLCPKKEEEVSESSRDLQSSISNLRFHVSLEDYSRLRKRCKEDGDCNPVVGCEIVNSCKSTRLTGIAATAPPCGTSSSSLLSGRGLTRKIGCIDDATQMGRKNKIEEDYVSGGTIERGKFGSVWLILNPPSCLRRWQSHCIIFIVLFIVLLLVLLLFFVIVVSVLEERDGSSGRKKKKRGRGRGRDRRGG